MFNPQVLLLGGFIGPIVYVLHDLIGGFITPDFSFVKNTVSDLTNSAARGNYPLGVALLFIASLMGAMFGIGIVMEHFNSRHRNLVYVGIAIAVTGFIQLFSATVFPQDPISAEFTREGVLHLAIVALSAVLAIVQLLLVSQWAYKTMNWNVFAVLSLATLILMLTGGLLSSVIVTQQWSVLGLVERLSVYTFQLWTMVFAYRLIRLPTAS